MTGFKEKVRTGSLPASSIKIILLLLLVPKFTLPNVHPHVIMAKQRPVF